MAKTEMMMEWESETEYGIPGQAWMLIDWHGECRVVACGGRELSYRVGENIGWTAFGSFGVGAWLETRLYAPMSDGLLIPLSGEVWLVCPQYHLSTGYLLLLRFPAPPRCVRTLAALGELGVIEVFDRVPMPPAAPAETAGEFLSACSRFLGRIRGIMPQSGHSGTDGEQMSQLLCHAAGLCGILPTPCATEAVLPEPEDAYDGDNRAAQDLPMFAAVMLMWMSFLHRCRLREVAWTFEKTAEGLAVSVTAPGIPENVAQNAPEIEACRTLAERNCQIFSCMAQEGTLQLLACTVRKDYALIGVKVEPLLYFSDECEDTIEKGTETNGTDQTTA